MRIATLRCNAENHTPKREINAASGTTGIAKSAEATREALYRALRPGSAPDLQLGFDTVSRACAALGRKLL